MRSIKTFGHGLTVARVYRDSEWNEYRVRILNNGHPLSALDYHTGDKADALDTAKSMLARILGQHVHTII
jgi:hypothetical protein